MNLYKSYLMFQLLYSEVVFNVVRIVSQRNVVHSSFFYFQLFNIQNNSQSISHSKACKNRKRLHHTLSFAAVSYK